MVEVLVQEYHTMRSMGNSAKTITATPRQLESLIRLSEAMARLHADSVIRPSYVREVCRLLRASNINIVKSDLEFADNQEEINAERNQDRDQGANLANSASNDLFVSTALSQKNKHINIVW